MTAPSLNNATAVVLAGGFGTRVRHIAPDVPKPMIAVCGRPFVEWVVRYLRRQGVRQVVLSTGFRSDVVEQHFAKEPMSRRADYVRGGTVGDGNRRAVFCTRRKNAGASPAFWIVANGDSLVLADFAEAARLLDEPGVQGVLGGRGGAGCRPLWYPGF